MVHGTHNALPDDRNKDVWIYINGEYKKREDAKISVFDSGYLVGDGIWEALRLHEGVLVFLDQHLDRFYTAAATVGMKVPYSPYELADILYQVVRKNKMHDGIHLRFMMTRGIKKTPSQDPRLTISPPNLVIIAEHKQADENSRNKGVTLWTSTIRRGSPDSLDPRLNCHSKLHEVMALVQAIEAGADEALMLDIHGMVSTCNATNFFMVKNGELWTSTGQYCMNGITRGAILQVAREAGMVALEKNFSLFDVYGADEAFVTGTFGGVTPVTKVDGRVVGEGTFGPISQRLQHLYEGLIHREVEKHTA